MSIFRTNKVLTLDERKARGAIFCGKSLTEQSHKDACDINKIMGSYLNTGVVPVPVDSVPRYGDFSGVHDYHSALNLICAAEDAFMDLPADVRHEFHHDPAEFLAAIENPAEKARLIALGVLFEPENFATPASQGDAFKSPKGAQEP